jgi:hypothetical protein
VTSTMEEGWGAQLPEEDNQSSDEGNFVDGDIRVRWRRRHWRDREADLRLRTAYANAIPFTLRMPNNVPNNGEVNAIMSEEDQAQRMISALYPEKDELLAKIEHVRELILMWHNMYDHKDSNRLRAYFRLWGVQPTWPTRTTPHQTLGYIRRWKCCWRYHFGWEGFRHIFAWLRDLIMELRPLLERITAMIRGMDRILEKLSIIADYAYHGGTEMQNSVIHNFIKQYTNWKEKLHTIHHRTQMSYYNHRIFCHHYRMRIFIRLFLNGWIPKKPYFVIKFDNMDFFDDEHTMKRNR